MPEKNTPITMKDIARELKVSVATVSRALKDSPRISAKRRDEIRRYAEEHNFSPNIIAESLRNRRVIKVIGVIVPQFTHFYFSSVLSGIEEEADKYGYRILVSQAINTSKYDHFTDLINKNVPLVFFDRICTGMNTCRVVVDDYMGAFSAVEYLIKTGCRHIAYYGSSMNLEISKNRYNGWHDALRKHGIDPDSCVKRFCDNREHAEKITPEVLNMEDRPDAFFAVNDDTAIGIMYTAKHMGLRIPEDISVCGFTNGQRAIACDPMLTTVEQNGKEVGRQAASILIGKAEGRIPLDKIEKRVVRTRLVVRGSTK